MSMNQPVAFAEVLDAAESLKPEDQAELVAVLNRRLAERGRSTSQLRSSRAGASSPPASASR